MMMMIFDEAWFVCIINVTLHWLKSNLSIILIQKKKPPLVRFPATKKWKILREEIQEGHFRIDRSIPSHLLWFNKISKIIIIFFYLNLKQKKTHMFYLIIENPPSNISADRFSFTESICMLYCLLFVCTFGYSLYLMTISMSACVCVCMPFNRVFSNNDTNFLYC